MSSNQGQLRVTANTARRAFTLVELMVVGMIIVILMVLTLFVMSSVSNSTKVSKTRATIHKLDVAMQSIYGTYEREFAIIKDKIRKHPDYSGLSEETRQQVAAHFIRDLMRMELPQNWAEVQTGPLSMTEGYAVEDSPLRKYYLQHGAASSAELLFLIIQNLNPEALEAFHGSEVADTDSDGLLEFVDAWGNPIQFLRWAPAFPDSDLQYNVLKEAGGLPNTNQKDNEKWWLERTDQKLLDAMTRASEYHSDPMDERINVVPHVVGWFLYPLIYSAGSDGKYGIYPATESDDKDTIIEPSMDGPETIFDPFGFPFGMPYGSEHFDNIHNHRWYRSF